MQRANGNREPQLGKPSEQRAECELALHACERGTETEVDAVPEREMTEILTIDVEEFSVAKASRVAVRCCQTHDHLGTRRDRHASDFDRRDRVAERGVRDGRVVSKEFLDRGCDLLGARPQGIEGVRVGEQRDDAVADQARGGVMTRDDQLEDRRHEFLLIEPLVAIAGKNQCAHEIVARRVLLRLDERAEHRNDKVRRFLRTLVLGGCAGRPQQCDQFASERLTVCFRYAEELADDGERKRKRKRGDEIDASVGPGRGDAVQQVVDD